MKPHFATDLPLGYRHRLSHRHVLQQRSALTSRASNIEAIFVPTNRSPAHLRFASQLAEEVKCKLYILASGGRTGDLDRLRVLRHSGAVIVYVPPNYMHPSLDFATGRHSRSMRALPTWDLDIKRNLALLISRMVGHRRLLFLDDDIRKLGTLHFRRASGLLDYFPVVSSHVETFPDNSVVCHALRFTGAPQETFASGSVLFVRLDLPPNFFPPIYNEDWFFLLPSLAGRGVATTGKAQQLLYDPFASASRARLQEFGDLTAEAMVRDLEQHVERRWLTPAYWRVQIDDRQRMLLDLDRHFERSQLPAAKRILRSIGAALSVSMTITAAECVDFFAALVEDQLRWRERWEAYPTGLTLRDALRELRLSTTAPDSTPAEKRVG